MSQLFFLKSETMGTAFFKKIIIILLKVFMSVCVCLGVCVCNIFSSSVFSKRQKKARTENAKSPFQKHPKVLLLACHYHINWVQSTVWGKKKARFLNIHRMFLNRKKRMYVWQSQASMTTSGRTCVLAFFQKTFPIFYIRVSSNVFRISVLYPVWNTKELTCVRREKVCKNDGTLMNQFFVYNNYGNNKTCINRRVKISFFVQCILYKRRCK